MPLLTTQSAKGFGFAKFGSTELASDFTTIATTSITSATATISFGSIPSSYSSLWVIGNPVAASSSCNLTWQYNGGSPNTYSYLYFENATSGGNSSVTYSLGPTYNTNGGPVIIKIPDYARTDKFKSATAQGGNSDYVGTMSSTWLSTNAITSIAFSLTGNNFAAGSSLTLYGLK
jgi:hypothetical protein